MVKHVVNLIIKVALFAVVLGILLSRMPAYSFGSILWLAVTMSILAYIVGDLLILPAYGNWTAVAADGLLVLFSLWLLPGLLGTSPVGFGTILMAAILLGLGEYYFHRYLQGELAVGSNMAEVHPDPGPEDAEKQ